MGNVKYMNTLNLLGNRRFKRSTGIQKIPEFESKTIEVAMIYGG